jgi:hypothetical protein
MTFQSKGLILLASTIRKENFHPHHYQGARIPLDVINVLLQPRRTFEEIETLAEDIATKNLMHPLLVARFNPERCQRYLEVINLLWGTTYQITELVSVLERDEETFYILLAGERRLRACKYLQEVGCEYCREKFGPGGCYKRHFGDQRVDVRLCVDISPLEALFIQASENIHMRVPPHEEARFYSELFHLVKQVKPDYPLSQFARQVGRSPETVREAIRFCLLPKEIQDFVAKGQISYGIACEIARLHTQLDMDERALRWWALRAITGNYKVPEFREMVSKFLQEHNSGQISLFGEAEEKQLRRFYFRRVVERQFIMAIWNFIYYFTRVLFLFQTGKLGKKDSPFSEKSPLRIYRKLIEIAENLLPHFWDLLRKEEREKAQKIFQETQRVISRLEEELPEETPK